MLDVIRILPDHTDYGPQTKRQIQDDVGVPVPTLDETQQFSQVNISQLATQILDQCYGWRNEDE